MMSFSSRFAVLTTLSLLAGCQAQPTAYYRLDLYHAALGRRHLGEIELDQLRDLEEVVLKFQYNNKEVLCEMDHSTTVYTDLALARLGLEHPPATYQSENCVLTLLNATIFDGIALFHGSPVHFHRTDEHLLELDDASPPQNESCGLLKATDTPHHHRLLYRDPTLTPERWNDCYPLVETGYKLNIGIAVGNRFQTRFADTTVAQIQSMVSGANFAFKHQMNVELAVDHLYLGPGAWDKHCPNGIDLQFHSFTKWPKPSEQGLWQIIDDCLGLSGQRYSGTAYRGVLCKAHGNTAITYCSGRGCSRGYKTLAHEIGHNLGARHSFEEGVRRTGGIMDYGGGYLDDIFQFNTKYRKEEICKTLRAHVSTCPAFRLNKRKRGNATPTQYPTPSTPEPTPYPTPYPSKATHHTPYPSVFPTQFPN